MTAPIPRDGPNFSGILRQKTEQFNRSARALVSGFSRIGVVDQSIATRLENLAAVNQTGFQNSHITIGRINTASNGLDQAGDLLSQLGSLAARAGDGTLNADDRLVLNDEAQGLLGQLTDLVDETRFNDQQVLQGDAVTTFVGQPLEFTDPDGNAILAPLGGLDLTSTGNAETALNQVNDALTALGSERAAVGAAYQKVTNAQEVALNQATELQAAANSFAATDVASEIANFITARTDLEVTAKVARLHQLNQKNVINFLTGGDT